MTRWLLLILFLLAPVAMAADDTWITPDEAEREAMRSLEKAKYKTARHKAEAILADENDSLQAQYVLAMVLFQAEANYPRALYLLQSLRDQLEGRYGKKPNTPESQIWHKRLITRMTWVLGKMDRRDDQLALLAYYDTIYTPPLDHLRIWPLLKLHRFAEARIIGEKRIFEDSQDIRERAYNGLIAIEDEAGNRRASYEWGKKAVAASRGKSCILNSNTALAARRCFDLEAAERFDREAIKSTDDSCPTAPEHQLTVLYLIKGQYQKSLEALKTLRTSPRTADQRAQSEMVIKARFVELLLALGQFDAAAERATQVVASPDRVGMISYSKEYIELNNAVLYSAVLAGKIQREMERAASTTIWDAISIFTKAQRLAVTRWEMRRTAIRLAADPDLLMKLVRPYYSELMPWYAGELAETLGSGLLHRAIRHGREIDADYAQQAGGFYDAFEAELAWRDGDWAATETAAKAALKALVPAEHMMRRRVEAMLADALMHRGAGEEARPLFHGLLQTAPTFLRLLGISLPVQVTHGQSEAAKLAFERLKDGPRIHSGDLGFKIDIRVDKDVLSICLRRDSGFEYGCAETPKDEDDDIDAWVSAGLMAFYDQVFAPKLELTQTDINSLDGIPTRMRADQAVKDLLGDKKKK